jgi:hypothetical protein
MEQSPSSEAASLAVLEKELPNILCNPKVHYQDPKRLPLVPVLSQINAVHTTPSNLKNNFKIICK